MPRRPSSTSASRASASASSRVIANIERVSMLFLTKTVYATLLAVLFGILVLEFPFLPRQLSITDGLTIGIPAFFLALMPNAQRYIPGFLRRSPGGGVPDRDRAACAAPLRRPHARRRLRAPDGAASAGGIPSGSGDPRGRGGLPRRARERDGRRAVPAEPLRGARRPRRDRLARRRRDHPVRTALGRRRGGAVAGERTVPPVRHAPRRRADRAAGVDPRPRAGVELVGGGADRGLPARAHRAVGAPARCCTPGEGGPG